MTTTKRISPAQVATGAGPRRPYVLGPGGSGAKPPTRPALRGPLPPWRRWLRKGLILGGTVGLGMVPAFQKNTPAIDPDSEVEKASFQVADGFEVNLFASDPMLAKPTQMNFDSRGRLWVACAEAYPQIKPGQEADDKIVILEDADGNGHAEKTTVFADKLLIPTGVEPGDGGAYVGAGTELIHLSDTDGDGKADRRRVVLSGFGTEDTHHIVHTLRRGPEGTLYFNQSIYIHSHVETPWGVRRLPGGGIWQYRPENANLEVFARGWVNAWGHHFDRWGQSFVTDGAGGRGINYVVPGGAYATAVGESRFVDGLNPGSPKFSGVEVLSGRHLPEDWRGNLITNDFRANRVCRFVVGDDGSGFASREMPELIKTRYSAFRPIDVKMGPDGAIYVADWYNPIIQHGEVDFRDPRRDHTRGRIWRITAKGRPLVARPKLHGASVVELLDALKAPEDWTRHFAKRELLEKGKAAVVPALARWVEGLDPADPDLEHHRLEALWTYQTLDVVEPALLSRLLEAKDPHARAAAVRVTAAWLGRIDSPHDRLAARVIDPDPRVRLEAVRALAHAPEPRSAEIALRAMGQPIDKFLDYALWLTLRDLQGFWMPALSEGKFDYGGDARRLIFALEAVGSTAAVPPLVAALKAGKVGPAEEDRVRSLIAALGGPGELAMIFDLALDPATPAARRASLLDALAQASARRQVAPSGDLGRVAALLDSEDPATRAAAALVAGSWKVEPLRERIEALARIDDPADPIRPSAVAGLAAFGGPAGRDALARLATGTRPARLRLEAAAALASIDANLAAERGVAALVQAEPGDPVAPFFEALVGRQGGPAALAKALAGTTLPAEVVQAGTRVAKATDKPDAALLAALEKAAGPSGATMTVARSAADRAAILADVARKGDPARGEAVFRRAAMQCLKCHAIAGAGGEVGPGLESIGGSAPVDYLLDSLLEPGKAVKEGYHATVVATTDGRVVTGLKVRQSDRELVLRDAEGREVSIPAGAIEEQSMGGSLMPAGLVDPLPRGELVDLVRFLSELGKLGPYAVSPARVARRWQVAAVESGANLDAAAADAKLAWAPAYATVAGTLPAADLPAGTGPALARTEIEVTTPGAVRLAIAPGPVKALWIDGRPVPPAAAIDQDLLTGRHWITFAVEGRPGPLRCEVQEVPGSPARVQPVLGR
ncbi:PVC-type heme-binding CxxCH protein [Tundrisphaera sp. TA3]|uniref:PVC-type heme-binding CxxCH protein n=1 Tax=Tundrisphaera sp. TA3 TaxID=3435775 RepID=UPI003EBCCF60